MGLRPRNHRDKIMTTKLASSLNIGDIVQVGTSDRSMVMKLELRHPEALKALMFIELQNGHMIACDAFREVKVFERENFTVKINLYITGLLNDGTPSFYTDIIGIVPDYWVKIKEVEIDVSDSTSNLLAIAHKVEKDKKRENES